MWIVVLLSFFLFLNPVPLQSANEACPGLHFAPLPPLPPPPPLVPVGAASCRREHKTMASCQNPPLVGSLQLSCYSALCKCTQLYFSGHITVRW